MAIINVFSGDLKNQLKRKGFEVIGEIGDNVSRPRRFTMRGDAKRLSVREKAGVELACKGLSKKKEQIYVPHERNH